MSLIPTIVMPKGVTGAALTVTVAPAVTAALYSAGNSAGGLMTLSNAVLNDGVMTSDLISLSILDRSNTKPSGSILIFNASPLSATTPATATDKTAFVYGTSDIFQIARLPVVSTDYVTINSKATANYSNVARALAATAGTTLYAVFVLDGTSAPTFISTSDLQLIFAFIPV